jgi:hypothetical protein
MDETLKTIDLTLRITCEAADAARFPPPSPTMQAVCRAVAETLALGGRFYVAPITIKWQPENREEHSHSPA